MKHLVLRCWWLSSLVFVAACFSPQFQDGQIKCGPNDECPPGLECVGDVCRADGTGVDAATGFPLTITLGGNMMGTVTSSPAGIDCGTDCTENFPSGTMVTLTATPSSGSTFVGWSGACSGTGACTITVATAINVTANFAVDNSLVVALAGDGSGIVSSNPAGINCGTQCMYQFPPSTMVTLTAFPATGSTFDGWSGGGCTGTGTCTVTTDTAKMVTATFSLTQNTLTVVLAGTGSGSVASTPSGINCGADCSEAYSYNTMVTLTATPTTGSTFTSWTGGACNGSTSMTCVVAMTQATSVTATFTLTQHALTVMKAGGGSGTVTSTPNGISCGADCTESYDYNTMVTLSATPSAGSTFTGWSGGGCSGTAACTVTMTMAETVTATFTLNSYSLSVAKSGNGSGSVSSNPAGINCGMDCSEPYLYNTMVTLTATPGTGSTFTGWSGGGCSGTAPCTVTVIAATMVNATFTLTQHTLSVTKAGNGSGVVTGLGINCGADCNDTVDYNTQITLTATPQPGSTFDGWSGGGCTGTGTCQVTVTQMTAVTATFTLTQHLLTIAKAGTGAGTVTSTPAGINCGSDCNELYEYNTAVMLTAAPTTGSTFGGWSGGGCSGPSLTCTTTITAAATVTATFTLTNQALTVQKTGAAQASGTVTSNVGSINCGTTCTSSYPYGTPVTLTAVAGSGGTFTGWSGGGCSGTGTCVVTMTGPITVQANFDATTTALSIAKSGTGAGTVTSVPAGINCGADCNENFTTGTAVTLTATPAAGSVFSNWSGGTCNGSTTNTCAITVGAPETITAVFTLTSHTLSVNKAGPGNGLVTSTDMPQGINCGSDCSQGYPYNTSVTLVATPAANAIFNGWSGGGCTGTGTCTVTITAATSVTATFALVQRSLTVKPDGDGTGTVTSSPMGINCGPDCDESYNDGQMVTLTPTPDTGSSFAGWSGDCTTVMGNMCILNMNADKVVVPTFDIALLTLTVNRNNPNGGDVFSTTDLGIDCGATCVASYAYNSFVSLKASPRSGFTFTGWTGACTGTGTCDVTMDMARSVTANFVVTTYTLTVNRGGTGSGTVVSTPGGISCGADCSEVYNDGQIIQLTATPATGSNFTSWSGCTSVSGTTCNVTMDASKSVTANFAIQQYAVNLTKAGAGSGTVTSNPSGINCGASCISASASFNYNTMVTLTASASVGSTFAGWSGACTGTGNCGPLTMTAAKNVTATFNAIAPNYAFVTSTTHTGNIGGLAAADNICQQRATAAGLAGTYKAFLSTSTVNAINRFGSARGWVRTDDKPFIDQLSDITNHVLYPIRLDENGTDVGNSAHLTGSNNAGTLHVFGSCSDWTSASGSTQVTYGYAGTNSYQVSFGGATYCSSSMRLLCLGTDRTAVVTVPTVNARRAFTTDGTWTPGGGLAAADSVCQSEANSAGLSGTFKALLPTTTASAISRFSTGAGTLPWARRDDVLLAPTSSALTLSSTTYLDASPNGNARNNQFHASTGVWGGGVMTLNQVAAPADTCSNWTSNSSVATGRGGQAGFSLVELLMRGFGGTIPCDATYMHLVCLQQ